MLRPVRTEDEKTISNVEVINGKLYATHRWNGKKYEIQKANGYILQSMYSWYEFKRLYFFFKIPLTK